MIEKNYQPAEIENRIAKAWEDAGAFKAGRPERKDAEPFTIVIPPPNVTGSLHMGHALNNTLQDILCRFERMRGRDVLWQPGTDHAGIATQMVVERQLMERQEPGRRDMGRAKFLERVWQWKAESGGAIVNQLKRLGASCDWSRERFTMDEGLSRAVAKVFVELYAQGLIYKDKRLVNWDPKLLTAISDLEVQQIEVKGSLWHLRYPLEGKEFNPEDPATFIVVATTRPETMLGDTAVAVNPEDDRYKSVVGKNVVLPLVGRLIPIVADDYSDPEKGSGAVKITPAHDFNDFEVGRRHNLRSISVLDQEARMSLSANEDYLRDLPEAALIFAEELHGKDRFAARKLIVAKLEEAGFLEKIEPNTHMVPHGDRSNVVIEPYLTDQWYVDAKTLAAPAIAAVRSGETAFVPKNWEKTYFEWMENIQPWCISRQLWWGHQIPAWYGPDGKVFVAETEDEAVGKALGYYVEQGVISPEQGEAMARDAAKREGFITRDEDVLDTWFSSALWPFSTLGWPDTDVDVKRYYPTNVLVTGFDIIFFWVARMMMMGLHFMKDVPFPTVYIHALVRDEKGAKMSKSKGNVIDPLHLIDDYGADALRFTLSAMAAQGRDIKLSTQRVEGYRNFATKLWNASRFAEMNGCALADGFDPANAKETLNRIRRAESKTARRFRGDVRAVDPVRDPLRGFGGCLGPIRCCRDNVNDLVAACFQLLKDHGESGLGPGLNVVQQQHALTLGLEPRQRVVDHLCGRNTPPIVGGEIRAPCHEATFTEFGLQQVTPAQARNTEERRELRGIGERARNVRDTIVNFGGHAFGRQLAEECRMVLAVGADSVSGIVHAAHVLRKFLRHASDHEERRLYALGGKNLENWIGVRRERAVVECQHHFVVLERQRFAVLHGADARMFFGVHDNGARGAECVRIAGTGRSLGN